MRPQVTVLSGGVSAAATPRSQLETAYQQFRLDRQGEMLSANTLEKPW